ncbi:MAG: 2-oxoglutarate and iron-dependent oxygenase domain-containing protein [Ilumatobacteraceae bacterium]
MTVPAAALPVLDVGPFIADETTSSADRFVADLGRAVHEIGFFYVVGHGIPDDLGDRAHDVARRFFALPESERLAIENVRSPQFRGYTRFGHERTNGRVDLRDQVDIGRELPAPSIGADDPPWLRLRGPNLWPDSLPELREVTLAWMDELERLGHVLLRALARALDLPPDTFASAVTPPEVLLKVIRYRTPDTQGGTPLAGGGQGVGAHRDTGFLSFVHQDAVGGLRVERDGRLIDVPHLRGALVVNIGEMFQLVTRGYYKATVHQVVSPPPGIERISLAYFFNPKLEATLTPVDLPPRLAALAPGGDSDDPGNPILANYGDNSLKVRLRAHPDVAAAHHSDLLTAGPWTTTAPGAPAPDEHGAGAGTGPSRSRSDEVQPPRRGVTMTP